MADKAKTYTAPEAIRQIISLLKGEWHDIAVVVIYAAGVGLCSLIFPTAVKSLVNTVAFGTLIQPVVVLTSVVGGVLLFAGLMRVFQLLAAEFIQRRLVARLGLTLASRIPHIHQEVFSKKYGPEYVLRFLEVFQVQKALAVLFLDGIALVFQITIGFTLVSFYHPLFLAFALCLLLIIVVILWLFGLNGVRTAVEESEAKYEVAAWLQDLAFNTTVFKSHGGERHAIARADELITTYLNRRGRHFLIVLRQVVASLLLQAFASSVLLGLGGWLVIKGQLSLGQLVAAELIFNIILMGVAKMGKHLEVFYDLAAGVHKLEAILDLPYENAGGARIDARSGPASIRFENVTTSPTHRGQSVLREASLTIAAGEKIAIWGANGAGKSYFANLLYRLTEPVDGLIRLDEFNLANIHAADLRRQVTLIRDVEIFHGSIRDNLSLGRKDISDTDIRKVIELVGLLDDVFSLPQGIDTVLRGTPEPLSRGQALGLMVARGLLQQARMLVFDGTLDLIDERARTQLLNSLLDHRIETTVVVLTHEQDILQLFPRKLKLGDGHLEDAAR